MELEKKPADHPDRDMDDTRMDLEIFAAGSIGGPDEPQKHVVGKMKETVMQLIQVDPTKLALVLFAGLAALMIVVRSGYTFRGEGHGVKVVVAPPDTPKPPPPELQQRGP
jgi:hypothetical protein